MCGAVCSTSREESCRRRMHMGSWGRVLRYDRIRSSHIEWSTHRGAKGLIRLMILLINTLMTMSLVSDSGSGGPPGGLSSSC